MALLQRMWIVLKRRWPVLLVCIALATIGAAVYNVTAERTYTATTELFLRAPDMKTSASAYQGDLFSRQRAQSYANILGSDELAQIVIDRLGLSETPQELASGIEASTITNTVIMAVSVTDANAQRAANIANAYGSVFADYVAKVENVQFDPTVPPLVQVITSAAAESATQNGYSAVVILGIAGLVGLSTGVAVMVLLERYDTRLRSRREIEECSGSRVIGRLPKVPAVSADSVDAAMRDSADFRESALRMALAVDRQLTREDSATPAIAVLSSRSGDGRTVVAQALTEALSLRGKSSKLVTAGEELPDDRDGIDVTVVDTAGFGESVQAEQIAESVDAAILVVQPNHSYKDDLVDLVATLGTLETPLLGVVANAAGAPKTTDGVFD